MRDFVTENIDGSVKEDPSAWLIKIEGPFTAEDAARKTLEYSKNPRLQKLRSSTDAEESIAHRKVSKYLQARGQTNLQESNPKPRADSSYMAGQLEKVPIGFGLAVEQPLKNALRTQVSTANQTATV